MQFPQQALDPILMLDRFVEDERELRDAPQPEAAPQLAPHEGRGALERAAGIAAGRGIAKRREIDTGVLQVRRDLHARDRQEAEAGVVELARNHVGDFSPNLIAHSIGTGSLRHVRLQALGSGPRASHTLPSDRPET